MTEMDIAQLATLGINTIRLPVGDWMYKPYGPYVGCTDGSLDEVDRLFVLCRRCSSYFCCLLRSGREDRWHSRMSTGGGTIWSVSSACFVEACL